MLNKYFILKHNSKYLELCKIYMPFSLSIFTVFLLGSDRDSNSGSMTRVTLIHVFPSPYFNLTHHVSNMCTIVLNNNEILIHYRIQRGSISRYGYSKDLYDSFRSTNVYIVDILREIF